MAEPNSAERAILSAWLLLGIIGSCILCLLRFPGVGLGITSIFGILLGIVSLIAGSVFKEDLASLRFSEDAKFYNWVVIVIVTALCTWGSLHVYHRATEHSGNIYGLNLWRDAGFDRSDAFDTKQSPVVNPPRVPTFPCPNSPDEQCGRILVGGDITNDTDFAITAVGFSQTVAGQTYNMNFQWANNCYSNAITIQPGETVFMLFQIPAMRYQLLRDYGRENVAPTMAMTDTSNKQWNIINKEDNTDPTTDRQAAEWKQLMFQCPDLWRSSSNS